jgi:spore germination protein KB
LAYHTALKISVLSVDYVARSSFPFLNAVREISLANFIERLDPFVVFIMMLGIFIKVGLFFYGGLKGLEYVFQRPYRQFSFPIGMLVALFSILIAGSFTEHIEEGLEFVPLYLHLPLQIGIPLVLALILMWKKHRKGRKITDEQPTTDQPA